MHCIFVAGTVDADENFYPASFQAEIDDIEWNGPHSGVNPWKPAQRLAKNPRLTLEQYRRCKFGRFKNVTPEGRCMEPLLAEPKASCQYCDGGMASKCLAPRTWVIGSILHFRNAYIRASGDKSDARVSPEVIS